ncbi:MAG: metal-sensitive transcriptional regulator [Cyanobacteria bacterium HKST-UBA06]|nr:metal-sensitive transcriptional regulator [Cyanobacteria bacterium HKST-UBA04]MCA9807433.1 metal-sensitive transcriptional regulator [Cyanobacteria bacterium HKST-UBA06]MCA9841992.1 metal-sensitive transcriptional regulator [Cyanobacteria bacterium HKST-UBA03]
MPITDTSKEKLLARLNRIMGHLNAVHRMVDEKRYCVDVLHQVKAVQAALDKVSEQILKQHLQTCVVEAIENQDTERVIDELVEVFRRAPNLTLNSDELLVQLNEQLNTPPASHDCCH